MAFRPGRFTVKNMASESEGFKVVFLLPNHEERTIPVGREQFIWDAAFEAGIALPSVCHQGHCLTCAAKLEGAGEVDQSASRTYYPEDREAGFVLPCTGKPRSDLRMRTHQQEQMRQFRNQMGLMAPSSWLHEKEEG